MSLAACKVGDELVSAKFGPLNIIDTVRWAGVQENVERLHFDREFAREKARLRTFIASGGYRQALLARALTDRIGPRGRLLKLRVRHTAPTFEGDRLHYSAQVTEIARREDGTAITCDVEGKNQQGEQVLVGSCVVLVPNADSSG
jgi:acyl dehydratase